MASGQYNDPLYVTQTAKSKFVLTAAMGTAAQVATAAPAILTNVINSTAQANATSIYDASGAAGAIPANLVWTGTLGVGAVVALNIPMLNGIVVQQSTAAVAGNVTIGYNG